MPIKIVNKTGKGQDTHVILVDKHGVETDITAAGEFFNTKIQIPYDGSECYRELKFFENVKLDPIEENQHF